MSVPAADKGEIQAVCPTGTWLVGGGYLTGRAVDPNQDPQMYVVASYPGGDDWRVIAYGGPSAKPDTLQAYALCASIS